MAHLRGSRSSGSLWRFPWDQLQRRHDWKKTVVSTRGPWGVVQGNH